MDVTWLTSKTVEIEMAADDVSTWDGTWRVGFVDPESVTDGEQVVVNLHLTSPLALAWQGIDDADFRQGASVEDTSLELVDRTDGSVVDPKELGGSVTAAVRLTDALQAEHELFTTDEPESLTDPPDLTVPEGVALGTGRVTTSLQITTAEPTLADGSTGEGMVLQPVLIGDSVTVLPPQNYPVGWGPNSTSGSSRRRPPRRPPWKLLGPGACGWIPQRPLSPAAPSEAGGHRGIASDAMSARGFLQVGEGETASLPLTLETGSHANGAVQGTVTVMVAPEGDPEAAQPVTVPFDADMRRPLDVTTAWTTFAVALVLGIGIPVAALYLLTWLTARVPRGTLVSGSTRVRIPDPGVPAQIGLSRRELHDVRAQLSPAHRDGCGADVPHACRAVPVRIALGGELADAAPSVSSATPGTRRGTSRLPLGMRGNWVAIPDRADPGWATLIVLLGSEDQEALDTVLDDARVRLGDRLRSLGGGVVAPAAGPGEDGGSAVLSDASGWGPAGGPAARRGGVSDPPTSGSGWGDSGQTGGSSGYSGSDQARLTGRVPTMVSRAAERLSFARRIMKHGEQPTEGKAHAQGTHHRVRRFRGKDPLLHDGLAPCRPRGPWSGRDPRMLAVRQRRHSDPGGARRAPSFGRGSGWHIRLLRRYRQLCPRRCRCDAEAASEWERGLAGRSQLDAAGPVGRHVSDLGRRRAFARDRPYAHALEGGADRARHSACHRRHEQRALAGAGAPHLGGRSRAGRRAGSGCGSSHPGRLVDGRGIGRLDDSGCVPHRQRDA